jgi:serine/threonine-protein kinase
MLARPAAIKLIRRDDVGTNPGTVIKATERFEREAQATAGLKSPHTVQLYEYGASPDGNLYYVMELLSGIDLETLVEKYGPLEPGRVVWLLSQVCHSLADAHHQGLIHRDIKPANIVICNMGLDYDFVKVLDFGLVALQPQMQTEAAKLTADGIVTGTPAYLAPEMASGGKVDGRADLYALGCVAYWLLTGRLVFEGETPVAIVLAHATQTPVPPSSISEMEIPESLERIVLACLSKDPQQRPESAADLAGQLAACDLPAPWSNAQASTWWEKHKPLN